MRHLFYSGMLLLIVEMLVGCGSTASSYRSQAGPYTVQLTFDEVARGECTGTVKILDDKQRPVIANEVTVSPIMTSMGHPSPLFKAEPQSAGIYQITGELFNMSGKWDVDVVISVGKRNETARFVLDVP